MKIWIGILSFTFLWELALADDSLEMPVTTSLGLETTHLIQDNPIESQAQTNHVTGNIVLRMRDGTEYVISAPNLTPEMEAQLGSMSKDELNLFLKKREAFLERAARIFHHTTKLAYGAGTLFKDKFYQIVRGRRNLVHPVKELVQQESPTILPSEKVKKYVEKTANLLSHLDFQLWVGAPVVAKNNEWGVALFTGGGAGLMINDNFKGPERFSSVMDKLHRISKNSFYNSLSLGIGLSYNYETRTITFDIFPEVESAIRALTVVAPTVSLKGYFYMANRSAVSSENGKGIYMPGPFDVKITGNTLFIGLSPIPTPEMAYAYESNIKRYSLINLSFSLTKKGFFAMGSTMRDLVSDGINTVESVSAKIRSFFAPKSLCSSLF